MKTLLAILTILLLPAICFAERPRCLVLSNDFCDSCEKQKREIDLLLREGFTASEGADTDFQFLNCALDPDIAKHYGTNTFPTLILIDKQGWRIASISAWMRAPQLKQWIETNGQSLQVPAPLPQAPGAWSGNGGRYQPQPLLPWRRGRR